MNLEFVAPEHLRINFDDARQASRVRPAIYGEIEGRGNREDFNHEVNSGLTNLRLGRDHDQISAVVPINRIGPISRYVHVMAERTPDPRVQGELYETYAQLHEFEVALHGLEVASKLEFGLAKG